MPTIRDSICAVAAHIIGAYDDARFADILDLEVAEEHSAKLILSETLLEAGAGPAVIMTAAMSDLTDDQLLTQLAGIQGQFEAVGALADWRLGGLDDLQSVAAEIAGIQGQAKAALMLGDEIRQHADEIAEGADDPKVLAGQLAALTFNVLAIADAHGIDLRQAIVDHMENRHGQ